MSKETIKVLADLQEKYRTTVGLLNEGSDADPEQLRSGGLGLLARDIGTALDLGFTRKRVWAALTAAGYPGSYGYFTVKMNRLFGKGKQTTTYSLGSGSLEPPPPALVGAREGVPVVKTEESEPSRPEKEDWEVRREEAALSIERDRERAQSLDEGAKKKKFVPKTFKVGE